MKCSIVKGDAICNLMNLSVHDVEISWYRLRKNYRFLQAKTLNDFLNEIHEQAE